MYCIYGKTSSIKELWCGREIAGREEEVYSHPDIKVCDFEASEFENIQVQAEDFQDLFRQIEKLDSKFSSFRVLYSLERPQDFDLYLF
jgi:hypothetical protein